MKDELTIQENYANSGVMSVDGHECEHAIGHDGYYDENNVWHHENDYDAEPEWRCLMRPLLREAKGHVEGAEESVENRAILKEKEELIRVHEELVAEAKKR